MDLGTKCDRFYTLLMNLVTKCGCNEFYTLLMNLGTTIYLLIRQSVVKIVIGTALVLIAARRVVGWAGVCHDKPAMNCKTHC